MALNPANFTLNTTSGFVDVPFVAIPLPSEIATIKSHTWVWGDGSITQSVSASHNYTVPGAYEIHHIASAYNGSTYTATQSVTANAWVEDQITMSWEDATIIAGIPSALTINVTSRDVPEKIILHYDNSKSSNPSLAQTNPLKYWDHLVPKWSFTEPGDYDHSITTGTVTSHPIYVNDSLIGWSSQSLVEFTDQLPCTEGTVWATLYYGPTVNSRVYAASSVRVDPIVPDSTNTTLRISRDGISNFGVDQYSGVPIPYVTTVVDARLPGLGIMHYTYDNSVPILFISTVTGDSFTINATTMSSSIICGTSSTHTTNVATATNVTASAYLLGSVEFPTISATTITLSALANFTVSPFEDQNQLRRFNEEFSMAELMSQYAPYHIVEKAPFFFGTYLNAIFGDAVSGTTQDIGIKVYEKIANFVQNHGDIDTCNVPQLISTAIMTGVPVDRIAHQLPDDFKRMLDIISVPFSRVAPTKCACNRTFKDCAACCDGGLACKLCKLDKRGNKGNQIDCATYTVSAGTSIVYYNKSTNAYNLLYTIPVSSGAVSSYAVEAIDYGGMIQPICDNYVLYEYLPTPSENPIESIINWDSTNTTADPTMSYAEWTAENGVMEQIIKYHLLRGINAATTVEIGTPAYPTWSSNPLDWDAYFAANAITIDQTPIVAPSYTFVPVGSGFSAQWLVAAPNGWIYGFGGSSVSAVDGFYKINSFTYEVVKFAPAQVIFGSPILANDGNIYFTGNTNDAIYKVDTSTDTISLMLTSTSQSWSLYRARASVGDDIYYVSTHGSGWWPKTYNLATNTIQTLTPTTSAYHSHARTVLAPDGNLYIAPYRSGRQFIKVDPATKDVSLFGPTFSIPTFGTDPFFELGHTISNGDTHLISGAPNLAGQLVAIVDSVAQTVTTTPVSSTMTFWWQSVYHLDDQIYIIGRQHPNKPELVRYEPLNNTFTRYTIPFAAEPGITPMIMSHTGQLVLSTQSIAMPAGEKGFWFVFAPKANVDINRVLSKNTSS